MSSFVDSVGGEGRRGSFLDHVDMSPSLKNIAVDLLNKNARNVQSRKPKSAASHSKQSSRRKRYNARGNRGTISMAEFKEMNKGVLAQLRVRQLLGRIEVQKRSLNRFVSQMVRPRVLIGHLFT